MGEDACRARLRRLLATADFEVIPLPGALEKATVLPSGTAVTVTASPSRGIQATVDLASTLQQSGYRAVPHLAARMIADRSHLRDILKALERSGVTGVFVVGGDPEPVGAYLDAGSLLRDMFDLGHPFPEIGIAGYPEGHPGIGGGQLAEALAEKASMATYLVTQMCFDGRAIIDWVRDVRAAGIDLPVRVGVPGAVETLRLVAMAARIGVGDSIRVLRKSRGLLRILRPGRYHADQLIDDVASADVGLGFDGLHFFTFNQVAATLAWRDGSLAPLESGNG